MTIWSELLVVLRKDTLEFYNLPSTTNSSISFVKILETPTIWEAAICNTVSASPCRVAPLRIIAITSLGVELCVVERHTLDDGPTCPSFCVARTPQHPSCKDPWYRLCIGETGRRGLWITANDPPNPRFPPHFIYMTVPLESSDPEMSRISWSNDESDHPALWGIPVVDFDEALGLTVVGNCFGELAVYDHVGVRPEGCAGLATDFTARKKLILPLLPNVSPLRPCPAKFSQ